MFDISPTEWTAILLSVRVAVVATLVSTPIGIAVAWLLARREFWGKSVVDALIHLPLVLPPVVTGYLLLLTFGRRGLVGAWLADHLVPPPGDEHPFVKPVAGVAERLVTTETLTGAEAVE